MEYLSKSVEETNKLAKKIADSLTGGEIILLNGDLGCGKTTFTKGLAKALGIEETVTSPTFTIMRDYVGRLKLYHFDMYRAENSDELYELGLDECLNDPNGVAVIEWNKYSSFDNDKIITLNFERIDNNTRRIKIDDESIINR